MLKWKAKWVTDETRITIIGCTSEPAEGNKKEFKKFFDKAIYFPFPDYTTRRLMWKTFIAEKGGKLRNDFPLSTLAHISAGYSAGSIQKTVDNVLTEFRKSKVRGPAGGGRAGGPGGGGGRRGRRGGHPIDLRQRPHRVPLDQGKPPPTAFP